MNAKQMSFRIVSAARFIRNRSLLLSRKIKKYILLSLFDLYFIANNPLIPILRAKCARDSFVYGRN